MPLSLSLGIKIGGLSMGDVSIPQAPVLSEAAVTVEDGIATFTGVIGTEGNDTTITILWGIVDGDLPNEIPVGVYTEDGTFEKEVDSDTFPSGEIFWQIKAENVGGVVFSTQQATLLNQNAWYGIERDETIASNDWTRIAGTGQMSLHASLPVQNSIKGVLMNADKSVNYYLKADDWTKKSDGTASNRTGSDGNVMAYKERPTYWKFETEGTVQRAKCSIYPLNGFTKYDKCFFGAYEGKLVGTKLSSIAGVLPTISRSKTQFRADARANGVGYNQQWYGQYTELEWMFIVEYATNNIQTPVNNTLTAEGYRQGGLGNGVTDVVGAEWSAYSGYNPFITCGASDSLANGSGEVATVIANFGGAGINRTFTVPRYRGIENIFGHIWKWTDGVSFNHLAATREVWIFDDPALITDNSSLNARFAGLLPGSGWVKNIQFGDKGDIIAKTIGGSSTTQFCDYIDTPAFGSGWRALVYGGCADSGSSAGAFYANVSYAASIMSATIGSRLCAR